MSGQNTFQILVLNDANMIGEHLVGLDRTGHMSFLTGQDRTPKFAGQVLLDLTESRLVYFVLF